MRSRRDDAPEGDWYVLLGILALIASIMATCGIVTAP